MILGTLLLLAGLTISAVAIYYSVLGLAAIFAAATLPIYIMGGVLEVSKLIAASWLKANWNRITGFIKWYMLSAVAILMIITSMGIFGFLSKAHLDQNLTSGGNQIQISEIDRQIALEKRSIEDATKVIDQLDQAVQVLTDAQRIRGRDGAIAVRRSQNQERSSLNEIIKNSNDRINQLEQQKLPLVQQKLNIEAEVGPIKYIAQFVYGNNPNKDILEKAVTWVIILIVIVFDPLAIAMLLASQMTFSWYKNNKEIKNEPILSNVDNNNNSIKNDISDSRREPILENNDIEEDIEISKKQTDDFDIDQHPYLFNRGHGFKDLKPMVFNPINKNETSEEKIVEPEITIEPVSTVDTTTSETVKKKIYDKEWGKSASSSENIEYVQNSEQTDNSLWNNIRKYDSEEFKSKDYLRYVFSKNNFEDFKYDLNNEVELDKFIKDIKSGNHSFSDYTQEQLTYFAKKIYEFRKN